MNAIYVFVIKFIAFFLLIEQTVHSIVTWFLFAACFFLFIAFIFIFINWLVVVVFFKFYFSLIMLINKLLTLKFVLIQQYIDISKWLV